MDFPHRPAPEAVTRQRSAAQLESGLAQPKQFLLNPCQRFVMRTGFPSFGSRDIRFQSLATLPRLKGQISTLQQGDTPFVGAAHQQCRRLRDLLARHLALNISTNARLTR